MDKSSSQKNLNHLDEYSKLKIFNYLDVKSLLKCTEVSKSWNELIGQKASLMQNVGLHMKTQVDDSIEKSDRNYQNLTLTNLLIDEPTLMRLEKILGKVKNLLLKQIVSFDNFVVFVAFVSSLTVVENLIIDQITIRNHSSDGQQDGTIPSDVQLNIQHLIINNVPVGAKDDESPHDFTLIEFLLSHQHSLRSLKLDLPSYRPDLNCLAYVKIVKILCDNYDKLKTIESFTTRLRTFHYRTDFIELLKCFGPSLKKLNMKVDSDALRELSPHLMSTIHSHMKLKVLSISLDEELCDVEEWIETRKNPPTIECSMISQRISNNHLNTLKLDKIMLSNSDKLFKGFPNISNFHLELCDAAPRPIELARNARSHLKFLKILSLPPQCEEMGLEN